MDKPILVKVPGAGEKRIYWDKSFRPIASIDANGNTQLIKYDANNRILNVFNSDEDLGSPNTIYNENGLDQYHDEELLKNDYEQYSFIKATNSRVLTPNGLGQWKKSTNSNDDLGRPLQSKYLLELDNTINSNTTYKYTDAGLVLEQVNILSGIEEVKCIKEFKYDDILRLTDSNISINGNDKQVSKLVYDSQDRVKSNLLGQHEGDAFLQSVDYLYDAAGRITHINKPGTTECLLDEAYCEFTGQFKANFITFPGSLDCSVLEKIIVDGQVYDEFSPLTLSLSINSTMANLIEEALDYFGKVGTAEVTTEGVPLSFGNFKIRISDSNAETIELGIGTACKNVILESGDCCLPSLPDPVPGVASSSNPDLYFQKMTFNKLDISRIEYTALCGNGKNRNEYVYDGDHRVTSMNNVVFTPQRQEGRYNTSYSYDAAGNILNLTRNGWISGIAEDAIFGPIDNLTYIYENERLKSVSDNAGGSGQVNGFKPSTTMYGYDGNGNIITDGYDESGNIISQNGKNLTTTQNILNLPSLLSVAQKGDLKFTYTFDGMKVRKEKEGEDRIYVNGTEFKNNKFEHLNFTNGRFVADGNKFQYTIKDHLGNSVVLFEDKNNDGIIDSENAEVEEEDVEVIQRNSYYPFGMAQQGLNYGQAEVDMDYQYNGKELFDDFGIGLSDYEARFYNPEIARFTSIDPLANKFTSWSTYTYVLNNPISKIDPDGKQAKDVIVEGIVWVPGATGEGQSEFVQQTFAALNHLTQNVNAGIVTTNERTGHIILDFVGSNLDVNIIKERVYGYPHSASEDGTRITFTPNSGIHVLRINSVGRKAGNMSPATMLAHEFGHAWLAQFSPLFNTALEAADAAPNNIDKDAINEHQWILENVVQPMARAYNEVVPNKITSSARSKDSSPSGTGQSQNYEIETEGSTSTVEKKN